MPGLAPQGAARLKGAQDVEIHLKIEGTITVSVLLGDGRVHRPMGFNPPRASG